MTPARSVEELVERHFRFPWRRPVVVVYNDGIRRYGCRVCMATHATRQDARCWPEPDQVERHIADEHPWLPDPKANR